MPNDTAALRSAHFSPTPEQQAIIDAGPDPRSIMIQAYAGTGKTATLVMLANAMPLRPSLALVFNRRNKLEMEERFPDHFKVSTLNGLGLGAWNKAIGRRSAVDSDKILKIAKEWTKQEQAKLTPEDFSALLALVRRARSMGLVPPKVMGQPKPLLTSDDWELVADAAYLDITSELIYAAEAILRQSIKLSFQGVIDYDDQIYMSALFGGVFPRFPVVMVDEAQDLSALNKIMVARSSPGKLIIVGDPRQAIYAFRGADSSSMQSLRSLRDEWIDLKLSTTWRCPKAVVERQQRHAPGFNAAPEAPLGQVIDLQAQPWSIATIEAHAGGSPVAILCRNNAPLLCAAIRVIKARRGVQLLGGEIGKGLVRLLKKIVGDLTTPISITCDLIREWQDREAGLARANEKPERVALINDRTECLLALTEDVHVRTAADMVKLLEELFSSSTSQVLLSTGHKAKGLEWHTVVHLDPKLIPSKYARKQLAEGNPVPMEQDRNLRYVIETRAKRNLILADLDMME